jgi:hypothetical protein
MGAMIMDARAITTKMRSRLLTVLGWCVGVGFGRWAGMAFILPAAIGVASYFGLKKLLPREPKVTLQLIAVQVGHLGWLAVGVLAPGGLGKVALDLVVVGGLLVWFGTTRGRVAVIALSIFQAIALLGNATALASATADQIAPLTVHILLRLVALALIGAFLVTERKSHDAQAAVFD